MFSASSLDTLLSGLILGRFLGFSFYFMSGKLNSRREFLKLSGIGALAFFTLPLRLDRLLASTLPEREVSLPRLGRVCTAKIDGYDRPSFNGELKKTYWRDLVLSITEVTLGAEDSGHNRIWYRVADEAYVHSGDIQPVDLQKQTPAASLPEGGALAEVSVPFTDTLWDLRRPDWFSYRLYYGTTYWVRALFEDEKGQPWYRIYDDLLQLVFFIRAEHLRIVPPEELTPLSPEVPEAEKSIIVSLPEQKLVAYEGERAVFRARISSGVGSGKTHYASTPTGQFTTFFKRPAGHMVGGSGGSAYDLPGVPWASYITDSGVSFHGTYWHNDFGKPHSHGCINLPNSQAKWLYRWTSPVVPPEKRHIYLPGSGTRVMIFEVPVFQTDSTAGYLPF